MEDIKFKGYKQGNKVTRRNMRIRQETGSTKNDRLNTRIRLNGGKERGSIRNEGKVDRKY